MESSLKEKFRKLHDTQATVVSTANYLIENSSKSKEIVKAWNQEFTQAALGKKLTLLYLANDVLQRCKTNAFLTDFLHYLPKATAHLYKHGDKELRTNLDRLVEVWDERKVLRSRGIEAVRNHLAKVKSTTQEDTQENQQSSKEAKLTMTSQGSKRKRVPGSSGHPIVEGLDEVQESANNTTQTENELAQFLASRDVGTLSEEHLKRVQELNGKHYEMLKREVNLRKKIVDLLRETLTEQEEGQKKAKELHRLCIARKGEIDARLAGSDQTRLQQQSQSLIEEAPVIGSGPPAYAAAHPPPFAYPVTMMQQNASFNYRPPTHPGPPALASHSVIQSVHQGNFFPVLHPNQRQDKPQDPQMNGVYHINRPFPPQDYIQSVQTCQQVSIPPHAIQELHGNGASFVHPIKFNGYQEQYDPEKEWGS